MHNISHGKWDRLSEREKYWWSRMLGLNQLCRLSSDVISPRKAHRLSLDIISPVTGYSSVQWDLVWYASYLSVISLVGCPSVKWDLAWHTGYFDVICPEGCLNVKDHECRLFRCNKSLRLTWNVKGPDVAGCFIAIGAYIYIYICVPMLRW